MYVCVVSNPALVCTYVHTHTHKQPCPSLSHSLSFSLCTHANGRVTSLKRGGGQEEDMHMQRTVVFFIMFMRGVPQCN
jgi:hypothetical protein